MKKDKKTKQIKVETKPLSNGVDTPVADSKVLPASPATEVALFKQAQNPLGDPNKI